MGSCSDVVGAFLIASFGLTVSGCTAATPPPQAVRVVIDPAQVERCNLKGILPPDSTASLRHDELGVSSLQLQAQVKHLGGNVLFMRERRGGAVEVYACPAQ